MVYEQLHLAMRQTPQASRQALVGRQLPFRNLLLCRSVADQHRRCRERLGRILCPNQTMIFSACLVESVSVAELGIQLCDGVSDRSLQDNTIAQFRQVDVGRKPVCQFRYKQVIPIVWPDRLQRVP